MKSKLALLLATILFFNIILPVRVHAAVVPDISQVTAVWDSNIDTSWDHVYLEYKSLDPQSKYDADKVIAANAYRFLISIGSKPLEGLNQQKFDDFLRAVSPFNIAYNNVLAEQVVHAAWTISGEQYKVFCANVIHNIASNPDYYNTHVIKNDPFVNGAGQQSLQIQYNDIDIDQSLNISNNIFNGQILSVSEGALSVSYYNPIPLYYNGGDINWDSLNVYRSLFNLPNCVICPGSGPGISYYSNSSHPVPENPSILTWYMNSSFFNPSTTSYWDYKDSSLPIQVNFNIPNSSTADISVNVSISRYSYYGSHTLVDGGNLFYVNNPVRYTSYFQLGYGKNFSVPRLSFESSNLKDLIYPLVDSFFNDLRQSFVYVPSFEVYVTEYHNYSPTYWQFQYYPLQSPSYVSPQFQAVNIYNNQYYGSDDDTFFHVDQMVDNIINNDYSTVNNGSNNTFYNDNYYITQPASGGGIELVTSSSIVYNYITIINNGGGNTSGGSIGSYPYPFDVRIINPEDIKNETEVNTQNEIINNYDFDINAGNLTNTITTVKNTAANNLNEVAPTTGSSIAWIPFMFNAIPSDLMKIIFSILIVAVVVCVYHSK